MTIKNFSLALLASLCFAAQPFSLLAQTGGGPTVRQFVGVNIKAENDLDKAQQFAHVREFHLWADDISILPADPLHPNDPSCPFEAGNIQQLRWNPSYNTNRYINYDDFYQALPQKVSVVTQGSAPSMHGSGYNPLVQDGKPICRTGSPNFSTASYHADPLAYKQQSIWQSLFAARYGAAPTGGFPAGFENAVATYVVAPDNTGLGRGLVREIENFNEQDAAWNDANVNRFTTDLENVVPVGQITSYFLKPAEYAAMLSANYDGNCQGIGFKIPGTNGACWGIKNISPETQVVMSGTADLRRNYINKVIEYCGLLRPNCGTLPFDVVNMHHYPTTNHPAINTDPNTITAYDYFRDGVNYFDSGEGTNPESPNDMLKQRVRHTLNGLSIGTKKLWITELGYDSHSGTNVATHPIGPFDRQTVQGQWLTRCIFELLASTPTLERVYLYKLQDDPGTGQFTHAGITDVSGKPKKSWFHVMTQLRVLGDYKYVETPDDPNIPRTKFFASNNPTNPGTPLAYDIPRIYKFLLPGNVDQPVYALWAPSKENITYSGMLFIPYAGFPITSALKIEVQDFDENGKRTLIPANDIVNIDGVGAYIKNLTITETPLYLKFNNKQDISDPVAQPVWDLQARRLCCGSVQLNWAMTFPDPITSVNIPEVSSGTVVSRRFKVYYAPTSAFDPGLPAFDLSKFTTVEENLAGLSYYECVVPGLQPGVEYYFFVVPIRDVAVGSENAFVQSLLPVLPTVGNLVLGRHYALHTVTDCGSTTGSCLLSVEDVGTIKGPENMQTETNQTFGVGLTGAQKCAELAGQPTGGINMDQNGLLSLTFSITFNSPQILKVIHFNHGTGGPGKIRIEVMEDCCNQWKLIGELDINNYNNWFSLANTYVGRRPVEQIRFTMVRYPLSNLLLPRIYFCAVPVLETCPNGTTGSLSTLTGPSDVTTKDVDSRSAIVTWTPGKDKDLAVNRYRLRYGVALDVQGNVVLPKETYKDAHGGETTLEYPLGGLTPGTLYYVDVDVDPKSLGCPVAAPSPGRATFTTLGSSAGGRSQPAAGQKPPALLSIYPNPSNSTVTVHSSETGHTDWTLTYSNGVHIRGGKVALDNDLTLDVSGLAPGLYIVTFLGGPQGPVAKTFVVQR